MKQGTTILLIVLVLVTGFGVLVPVSVNAGLVPCGGPGQNACTVNDLFQLAARIFNWLLGLAGVVAILIIILAGLGMLTYHWFESPETALQGAKSTLTRAITGLIVIAIAYIVVNTLLVTILGVDANSGIGLLLKQYGLIK